MCPKKIFLFSHGVSDFRPSPTGGRREGGAALAAAPAGALLGGGVQGLRRSEFG